MWNSTRKLKHIQGIKQLNRSNEEKDISENQTVNLMTLSTYIVYTIICHEPVCWEKDRV